MTTSASFQSFRGTKFFLAGSAHALAYALAIAINLGTLRPAVGATPEAINEKLDRIFILTAVDEAGNPLIIKANTQKASKTIYASISTLGYATIQSAIQGSSNPAEHPSFKLIPESLGYFLRTWANLRNADPTISASIIPDPAETRIALALLEGQGMSKNEARSSLGSDATVFCPVPAVFAEETTKTFHRRKSGTKFIPCSFSESTLREILRDALAKDQVAIVPLPLWQFIKNLSKESDDAITSVEVVAHPTLIKGMDSAWRSKSFTLKKSTPQSSNGSAKSAD
jgi:hypothetical protein